MDPLIKAAAKGNLKEINSLISQLVNKRSTVTSDRLRIKVGDAPLIPATVLFHHRVVKRLIELGADVNLTDAYGYAPIHLTSSEGVYDPPPNYDHVIQLRTLKALLSAPGIDVDKLDPHGETLLERAIFSEDEKFIEMLIDAGADIHKVIDGRNLLEGVLAYIEQISTRNQTDETLGNVALLLIRRGLRVRPGNEHLLRFLTTTDANRKRFLEAMGNAAWKRRSHFGMAWQMAQNEKAAAAAEEEYSEDNNEVAAKANNNNLPPLERIVPGEANQGGGRRRSIRKRKVSNKTRRSHRK